MPPQAVNVPAEAPYHYYPIHSSVLPSAIFPIFFYKAVVNSRTRPACKPTGELAIAPDRA
ncbi:MAG: hypothetical protein F6J93_11200 [Oscillatoria sp. SIO1A7]|nr:hypothetical protein [Oscillatoria sp. SIO1A7]